MRDPEGKLEIAGDHVTRYVDAQSPALEFLRSDCARSLVESGKLIPYSFTRDRVIVASRYPFVSHPYEWTDAQLASAARLTIGLAREILPVGHELKDASAWNVIFRGARPVFCDHLSFRPIAQREWWAFGQYVRHFILPLAMARVTGAPAFRAFQLARDGLDVRSARALLGPRRFLTRYWPLMLDMGSKARAAPHAPKDVTPFRERIYGYCEIQLPRRSEAAGSRWSSYEFERRHYSDEAAQFKRRTVHRWLGECRPGFVVDLGCNTGEYAAIAAECGAGIVVAIDSDHASLQVLFERNSTSAVIHPVLADLSDLPGGRGWMGEELPGLVARLAGRADAVICLALLHHLAIAESIPLEQTARLLATIARRHAIVELIDDADPMLVTLAAQRQRDPREFSLPRQLAALAAHFDIEADAAIPGTARRMVMLRVRPGQPPAAL